MSMAMRSTGVNPVVQLEETYLLQRRPQLYIVCEEHDFTWNLSAVARFDETWNKGTPLDIIAEDFERPIDEVFLLAFDRATKGKIDARKGGVYGSVIDAEEPVDMKKLTPDQRAAALRIMEQGVSDSDIAAVVGVSRQAITYIKRRKTTKRTSSTNV